MQLILCHNDDDADVDAANAAAAKDDTTKASKTETETTAKKMEEDKMEAEAGMYWLSSLLHIVLLSNTFILISNLIAKAKAEAEARAKAEADLSAKMKAQPSDFASDDSSKEEDDTQAFIATLNANTNKILAEDEKEVDGIFKSPIEETATPNEETATPDLSMDVSDDEAAAKANSVLDLFPSEPPESPAVRTKKSKSSSKKKGSSSKHTYAKEIEILVPNDQILVPNELRMNPKQ